MAILNNKSWPHFIPDNVEMQNPGDNTGNPDNTEGELGVCERKLWQY